MLRILLDAVVAVSDLTAGAGAIVLDVTARAKGTDARIAAVGAVLVGCTVGLAGAIIDEEKTVKAILTDHGLIVTLDAMVDVTFAVSVVGTSLERGEQAGREDEEIAQI